MNARVSGQLAAFVCFAAVIAVPVVAAQPMPASPTGVELRYEAFAGCPERDAFAKNLAARQRGAATTAVQLDVRLRDLAADGVEGSITVRSDNGESSARRIVASTCAEAADALALIAALALQGIEVEQVPADDVDEPSTSRRTARRAKVPPSESTSDGGAVSEAVPTTPIATPREAAAETATESKTESEVIYESAGEVRERASEGDPIEPDAEQAVRAYVLVSGGVASGVLPSLQPSPELALGLTQGPPGVVFWSAHAAFRISPDQTRHFDQGVVTFGWWTGLAAACLGARGSGLSASGCAALEVGVLSGDASQTESPQSERRAWVALGPGLMIGYDVVPALRLSLRAELLTPLARYRLELPSGSAVHEPSALGLRAGLGASLWLE